MRRPELLLLDEAHAGLDADADAIVDALIRLTCGSGGAVVMVSHDAPRLHSECDHVLVLDPDQP
jgi:heme exporter protein A